MCRSCRHQVVAYFYTFKEEEEEKEVLFISLGGPSLIARVSFVRPWRSIDPPQRAGRLLLLLLLWVSFFYEWVKSAKRPTALQNNRDTKRQLPTKWKREKAQAKPKCCLFFSLYSLFFLSLNQRSCTGRYKTNTCNEALERECQRALECCRQLLALSLPHGGPAPRAIWGFSLLYTRARLCMSECCDHTCIHNVSPLIIMMCTTHDDYVWFPDSFF